MTQSVVGATVLLDDVTVVRGNVLLETIGFWVAQRFSAAIETPRKRL